MIFSLSVSIATDLRITTIILFQSSTLSSANMSERAFVPGPITKRMEFAGGPSVWLEFSPLARQTNAMNLGQGMPSVYIKILSCREAFFSL